MKTQLGIFLITLAMATGLAATEMDWTMAAALYSHPRARQIGDLLTVLIEEKSEVKKDVMNQTDKAYDFSAGLSVAHPRIDGRDVAWTNFSLPTWSASGSRKFSGKGGIENSDSFTAAITVRVIDVLPNGNLVIEGKRDISMKSEGVRMVLSGTVRAVDIDNDNTIDSSKIADAVIRYEANGPLDQTQKQGLVPRIVDWVNPF